MITIMPNIWMLLFRIALLALFGFIYQRGPLEKIATGQYQTNEGVFWLSIAFYSIFPAYLIWTLLGVMWVRISKDMSKICFHYFYKTFKVGSIEIDNYYETKHNTKLSNFKGLLIKLKSGKVIEVTGYNLKSVKEIVTFLRYNKVPYKGDKNSWFPMKRKIQ